MEMNLWDCCVEEALAKLGLLQLVKTLRPIAPSRERLNPEDEGALEVFDEMQPWDRASVEIEIADSTYQKWLLGIPSSGDEVVTKDGAIKSSVLEDPNQFKKLILFSGNDYLGLGSHPTIGRAAAKAALEHKMGPRGSALICGYTFHHRLLESCLAKLKKKEDCLICPTGFAANTALMVAIGSIGSLLNEDQKIAIFSDLLNHASIIDGIRLAERQGNVKLFIYRHCDMAHLNALLSSCTLTKKVVVTDTLFSMDGDFAPMRELANLRQKHGFLLVVDDAHGTLVCGQSGGGVAEQFNCERDVDICVGTLSKAVGCFGGFIACSKRWKLFIQSSGRSFMFSTAAPIPIIAAARAAVLVAEKEMWRRTEIWNRVQDFRDLTGIPVQSPIISLVVGSEEKALKTSRHLLKSGFHVSAIRPPAVPPNACRLRVTLSATHTREDVKNLTTALSQCISFQDIAINAANGHARL